MSTDRPGATEYSPSEVRADEPMVARVMGLAGLGATTLGVAAVIANQFSPRWISEGIGYLLAVMGVVFLLYHAIRDGDLEVRRLYGGLGAILLATALVVSVLPGRPAPSVASVYGYHFLPWGPLCGLLGLLFGLAFLKNETDEQYRRWGAALLGVGVGCVLLAAAFGIGTAAVPVAPVVVLGLLGLLFLCGFLAQTDTSAGLGHWVAIGVGVVGAGLALVALGRAIFPTVLFDGAKALRKADQAWDYWKIGGRIALILVCLYAGFRAARGQRLAGWLRALGTLAALAFAGVFVVGTFGNPVTVEPTDYLVPSGVVLIGLGLTLLLASVAAVSDHPLVVLTRRELASYFHSPIAYLVLAGMAVFAGFGHSQFLGLIARNPDGMPEPMVRYDWALTVLAAIGSLFLVPAVTMRAFSEEKRTGTLEVLLTAPVGEGTVVLSKFFAGWLFYLAAFVPAGLYLLTLWVAGGKSFEYRTVIAYYLAVAATGVGFVGFGLFCSSLTKNQVIAAVMTFTGVAALFLTFSDVRENLTPFLGPGLLSLLGKFDYWGLWLQCLAGQIPVSPICVYLSFGAFWLFLTVRVLEARKWS